MQAEKLCRRRFLKGAALAAVGVIAAACAPRIVEVEKVVEREVTKIVKEVVQETVLVAGTPEVVEKEVTKIVKEVVKETVVVEKEVAVAPTPGPELVLWAPKHFLPAQNDFFTASALLAAARNNFEVEVQMFPWGEYQQKQNVAIEAKTLPDVCLGVGVARYQKMGILLDVSNLFAEIGETGGGWYDVNERGVTVEGKQWGIPFHNEPQFMYYRSDVLGDAGYEPLLKDLDEFVAAAMAVTDPAERMWGFGNTFSNVPDGNNAFLMFMWAFGGSLQDEQGNIVVNSPETLEALNFYCDLYTKHEVMPPGATGWDDTGNNKAYLSGQCAMIINTGSVVNALRGDDPGWLNDTMLGPLPAGPAGAQGFNGGSTAGLFYTTEYPEQAGLLMKGLLAPDRYGGNLRTGGGFMFPVLNDYADDPFFTEDQWNKQIVAALPYMKQGNYPGDPEPWSGDLVWPWSTMATRVVVEGWDPQEALAALEKDAIEAKEKWDKL